MAAPNAWDLKRIVTRGNEPKQLQIDRMGGFSGVNPTDDPALRLVGNWQAVLVADEAQFSYFRITADRRFFGVVPYEPRPGKTVCGATLSMTVC